MLIVLMIAGGIVLLAMGLWWLWAGRWNWLPLARFQRDVTLPTRLVTGLVHLVLGYHLLVWSVPGTGDRRGVQVPRTAWPWLVLGCAVAIGGSKALDRLDSGAGGGDRGEGEHRS